MNEVSPIVMTLKEIVHRYDETAEIIFFGSRARGDWEAESDWDFLILSSLPHNEELVQQVRKDILHEIEFVTFDCVNTIWKNKDVWKKNYAVTNIYKSIKEEGRLV